MYPYVVVAGRELSSYALLSLVGMAAAILLALWNTGHHSREDVFNAMLFGGIGAAVGGKLLYLLTITPALVKNWAVLSQDLPAALYSLITGGFVYYGGLFGAMSMVWLYARRYKLPAASLLDTLVPSVPLFHTFGRVGCLLAGCCYGIPYGGAGAVLVAGQLRFPVQLAEASVNLLLVAVLLCMLRRGRAAAGRVTAVYLVAYAAARFMLEYLRGDLARGFWFGLSTSQWLSLASAALGVYMWYYSHFAKKDEIAKISVDNQTSL